MLETSIEKAFRITGKFEGGRGFSNVAGNFDGMGMSFGYFQWNAGMYTLQPLLRRTLELLGHDKAKEIFTNDDLYVLRKKLESNSGFVQWCRSLNDSRSRIIDPWYTRFYKLGLTKECQQAQIEASSEYVNDAKKDMKDLGFKSERAFCLCFDIEIQNGSITRRAKEQYDARVSQSMNEKSKLLILANAVANTSRSKIITYRTINGVRRPWTIQDDVRSRKHCIVLGKGTVHGTYYELDINDDPVVYEKKE